MYGTQWRYWRGKPTIYNDSEEAYETHDQLQEVIESIKTNPYSRRHIVTALNVADLPNESVSPQENVINGKMALAPCHHFFQFYVRNGELSLHFSMRSTDIFLGLPFNIASYATLLVMVAQLTRLKPRILSYHGGDIHLYKNHIEQANRQILREPTKLPYIKINDKINNIDDFKYQDIELLMYKCQTRIPGKISV